MLRMPVIIISVVRDSINNSINPIPTPLTQELERNLFNNDFVSGMFLGAAITSFILIGLLCKSEC